MAIIDNTYFIGEISIPNNAVNNAELTRAIETVERETLKKLLGTIHDYLKPMTKGG